MSSETPPRIRMVALDIDGTLLDPAEEIRPRVRRAIRDATAAGCLVTLATGRRLVSAQHIAQELGLSLPLILHGGAVVQDSTTGAVIYQDPLEPETVAAIVRTVVASGCQPIVYESPAFGGRVFTAPPERDSVPVQQYDDLRGPFERLPVDELERVRHVLSVAVLSDVSDLAPLAAEIGRIPDTAPLLTVWHLFRCQALEIFHGGCSKATALARVAEAHDIALDEVMAIGDGLNDCEILAAVGLGVAMGNACPEARAAARVSVGTNEQDGVAEAIERYILGR